MTPSEILNLVQNCNETAIWVIKVALEGGIQGFQNKKKGDPKRDDLVHGLVAILDELLMPHVKIVKENTQNAETAIQDTATQRVVPAVASTSTNIENATFAEIAARQTPQDKNSTQNKEKRNAKNVTRGQKVCPAFKRFDCPYGYKGINKDGIKCPEGEHPKPCTKFSKFGRSFGGCRDKNCKYLHFRICKQNFHGRVCPCDESCKMHHINAIQNPRNETQNQNQREQVQRSFLEMARKMHPRQLMGMIYPQLRQHPLF